jgi:hypothetical protein
MQRGQPPHLVELGRFERGLQPFKAGQPGILAEIEQAAEAALVQAGKTGEFGVCQPQEPGALGDLL